MRPTIPHKRRSRSNCGVEEFFQHREAGVTPFAEAVLSLRGKWEFAKSKLPTADDDAHLRFLNAKFEEHLFKIDDLKQTVEHAIGGFVSRVQGIEGRLLVDVRADLSDGEFAAAGLPKFLLNDEAFRAEFDRAVAGAAAEVADDFQVAVSREVVSFVAGEVAAQVAVRSGDGRCGPTRRFRRRAGHRSRRRLGDVRHRARRRRGGRRGHFSSRKDGRLRSGGPCV